MTKEEFLQLQADFSWDWNDRFFLEIPILGLFEWSDPDYGGDNTIKKSRWNSIKEYCEFGPAGPDHFVRSKGIHVIEQYCGSDIVLMLED